MFKKSISFILALSMMLSLSTTAFAANSTGDENNSDLLTSDQIISMMQQDKAKAKTTEDRKEVIQNMKKFESLSESDQEKIVEYFSDEDLMTQVYNAFQENKNTSFENGDIIVSTESTESTSNDSTNLSGTVLQSSLLAKSTVYTTTATYKRYVTFAGIKVFQTTSWVKYTRTTSKISSIIGYNHYVSINYNPLLDCSFSGQIGYISGSKAYSSTDLTFSVLYKGVITFKSGNLYVWGDTSGGAGGNCTASD